MAKVLTFYANYWHFHLISFSAFLHHNFGTESKNLKLCPSTLLCQQLSSLFCCFMYHQGLDKTSVLSYILSPYFDFRHGLTKMLRLELGLLLPQAPKVLVLQTSATMASFAFLVKPKLHRCPVLIVINSLSLTCFYNPSKIATTLITVIILFSSSSLMIFWVTKPYPQDSRSSTYLKHMMLFSNSQQYFHPYSLDHSIVFTFPRNVSISQPFFSP